MKLTFAALVLALAATPVWAADPSTGTPVENRSAHAFNIRDLAMMDRVSDAQLSPDGRYAAFSVRSTDYAANKGVNAIYVLDLEKSGPPAKVLAKGSSARWSVDGHSLYYVAPADGVAQLWRLDLGEGKNGLSLQALNAPTQISRGVLDLGDYKLSPDGKSMLLSYGVFTDCADLACTKERLDGAAQGKASGKVYDKLFIRHWDTWADGRRNQLFIARFDGDGKLPVEPTLLSRDIDGDIPSKPDGDNNEFSFSPDGQTVYFDVRIAGTSEAWSTNFDVYAVPADGSTVPRNLTAENRAWDANPLASPDGKTLYYLAMKAVGSESDRFAIMALDLASGQKREIDPDWDRSPGSLSISADGKTLYATADDNGQHPLFAIDTASGKVAKLTGEGNVGSFSLAGKRLLLAHDDLRHPADIYTLDASHADGTGRSMKQVTHFNAAQLKVAKLGEYEFFNYKGWNDESVQGYVVKPVDYKRGRKYPVAFIIHGGPQSPSGNTWGYRWNPQTYAGQGFAVVAVNFHGTPGFGQKFVDSIANDWGGKPLDDLKAGWQAALNKYAFLDASRACALGASYGGYMVYWIAGVWNQPWKCFVAHDGVFDTREMYYDTEELWSEEDGYGGTQYEHPENYEKFNPINHVKDWRVPMLVVHSGNDFRIPITQGLAAFTALQRRGIPSQLLTFPDENHWVLKPQNSVQWHETVNAWLKKWTAKDAPAVP